MVHTFVSQMQRRVRVVDLKLCIENVRLIIFRLRALASHARADIIGRLVPAHMLFLPASRRVVALQALARFGFAHLTLETLAAF
jgi:hypothetical protein